MAATSHGRRSPGQAHGVDAVPSRRHAHAHRAYVEPGDLTGGGGRGISSVGVRVCVYVCVNGWVQDKGKERPLTDHATHAQEQVGLIRVGGGAVVEEKVGADAGEGDAEVEQRLCAVACSATGECEWSGVSDSARGSLTRCHCSRSLTEWQDTQENCSTPALPHLLWGYERTCHLV
jgi:hypothetical protein